MTWWQDCLYALACGGILFVLTVVGIYLDCLLLQPLLARIHARSESRRSAQVVARYRAGECYCPVHGWMLKADSAEHTRAFHAN